MKKSELREMIREILKEELHAKKQLEETLTDLNEVEMYIVLNEGGTDGAIHYMGKDLKSATKVYKSTARDYVKYGMGGGDSYVCLYEYTGPVAVFNNIYDIWKKNPSDPDISYYTDIEDLGFDPEYCEIVEYTEC